MIKKWILASLLCNLLTAFLIDVHWSKLPYYQYETPQEEVSLSQEAEHHRRKQADEEQPLPDNVQKIADVLWDFDRLKPYYRRSDPGTRAEIEAIYVEGLLTVRNFLPHTARSAPKSERVERILSRAAEWNNWAAQYQSQDVLICAVRNYLSGRRNC